MSITVICIVLFTDLSIEKIMIVLALITIVIVLFNIIRDSTSMLIVGLVGIILVLLFAMASGVGRAQAPVVISKECTPEPMPRLSKASLKCPPSGIAPTGKCPPNYTNYADNNGDTLCCASSNIDIYSHKCPASGPNGICSMAPGLEDPRSPTYHKKMYPLCQTLNLSAGSGDKTSKNSLSATKLKTHASTTKKNTQEFGAFRIPGKHYGKDGKDDT